MEEEEQTLILSECDHIVYSVNIVGKKKIVDWHVLSIHASMRLFLAPPEHDDANSPRNFHKDELLHFLRVCITYDE